MKTSKRLLLPIVSACCALFLLSGCADKNSADKNTIRLATGNWPEGIAVSQLLEALIGDMGYTVKTTLADPAPIFTAVANGQQDVMIETWLPLFHQSYFDQYGAKLEVIGTWFESAQVGLVVPGYVTIDSIEEMNPVADDFNGKIVGFDAGASTMIVAEEAIKQYGLNYELIASSEAAMLAYLQNAIEKKEWVVIPGWEPHTMFARYDLKFLTDPKGLFGEPERIEATARKGFSKEYPEIAKLFSRMKFTTAEIGSLMDLIDKSTPQTEKTLIREWISKNQALVDSWFVE